MCWIVLIWWTTFVAYLSLQCLDCYVCRLPTKWPYSLQSRATVERDCLEHAFPGRTELWIKCISTRFIAYRVSLHWHNTVETVMERIYSVGQKNWTCLSVDNSAMVTRRKASNMSKVLEFCRQNGPNLHSKSFKYSLFNLHKSSLLLKLGICLHSHVPEFIELKNSLPKSSDLNSVNYSVLGHCNRYHGHKISVTDQLKCVLIECWAQLILNTLTPAIDQRPKRTDDGYECKSWVTAYVKFYLNSTYALMIVDISLYAERKLT